MPDDPLQTLREGHAAFNRGDTSWPTVRCAEDVEWGTLGAFPGMEGVYRGWDGVVEWMETVRAEWEEFEVSLPEVLASRRTRWRSSSGSGAEAGRAGPRAR